MTIKTRLVLSYLAMIIIPIVLFVFSLPLITSIFIGANSGRLKNLYSSDSRLYKHTAAMLKANPDLMLDPKTWTDLEKKFKVGVIKVGAVVRKQASFIYISDFLPLSVLKKIPREGKIDQLQFNQDNDYILVDQFEFQFIDRSWGTAFIFSGTKNLERLNKTIFFFQIIAGIVILVLTNGTLSFSMARSIIKPLKRLQNASEQIKDGNLNFQIATKSKDEIGQLAAAFEEMRTRLKETLEKQIQYENNRKELISGISHDLKTPISAIKGYVEGIMDGVPDTPEKMAKYVKTIYTKATDLDQLTDELFLFSKLDLKKLPFDFEKVDLRAFLLDCLEELQFDLEKKGIHLTFDANTADPVMIIADREKLKRVIVNVLGNSEKYMDVKKGHKQIRIELQCDESNVIVQIRDNGIGIPAENLPYIFDSFYRTDQSRNSSTGGSGLGLAIAKQIVEEHHGKIWAQSVYGEGTEVYINLKKIATT